MIYKQAQIDKFLKRPDNSLRAVLVYGSNEGLMAEQVKNFTKAICDDVNDPFRVAYLNGNFVWGIRQPIADGRPAGYCRARCR